QQQKYLGIPLHSLDPQTRVLLTCIRFDVTTARFVHYCAAASPPPPPKLQGERIMSGVALEEAWRIGSTPPSNVMMVLGVVEEPSVATIMSASPLLKSAMAATGMRPSIC